MPAPALVKPVPAQIVNEQAAYGPFDLNEFVQSPEDDLAQFSAELANGQPLPKGLICTGDGILTGIPYKGTQGHYEFVVTAKNQVGSLQIKFDFTIKTSLTQPSDTYFDQLKAKAEGENIPTPELDDLLNRPVTILDVYYLLERWATLKVWDAFNLDPPGPLKPLKLAGASPHYNIYDRGSCIVAIPRDLFSHERTLVDGIRTAQAVAREVYRRSWTVELVGFDKLTRATWVELQHLGVRFGKQLEIVNYQPTSDDLKVYYIQTHDIRMQSSLG